MMAKDTTEKVIDEQTKAHLGFGARLRGYFLAGIVVTAPISITIYLTYVFLTFIDRNVSKFVPLHWYEGVHAGTTLPGLGIVVALLFFIIVGWFATNFLGRLFIRLAEYVLDRMPVIRTIYGATKQIFETVMATQSQAFREVIMIEYPRKGIWSLGFVTGVTQGEVQTLTEDEVVNVFIPTTPNPTSGFLLFVPRKDIIFLEMSVEEGIKMVVSAGIIMPVPPKHKVVKTPKTPKLPKLPKLPKKKKPKA